MAIKNKIISFWKQVKLRSSDMFTLFRVGIGVKVPTHKLHVKDKADPVKVEGMTSKTLTSSDATSYNIIQADSNGVFYTTSNVGGIAINEIYDRSGDLYLSSLGAGDTLISKDLTIGGNTIKFKSTVDGLTTNLTAVNATGSTKTLTLPNLTGTVATTSVAGGGTGASTFTSNAILTGNGTSAIQAESTLTYTGETLSIGNDDNGDITIERNDHTDGAGGDFRVFAGSAGGDNTAGGSVKIYAGYGKGSGGGGDIQFISNGTSGTASTTPTPAVVAVISKEGNLQIDGSLTTGSTLFANSSGVVQVATQGTIDHDSLANFVANEHIDWTGASAGTIHATNYTNTTYSEATSSDAGLMSTAHHDKLDGIEAGATADQTQADINGLAITTVGTISSGTWQGTDISLAYLDSNTANLISTQTFLGQKTFAKPLIVDDNRSLAPGNGAAIHVEALDITDNDTSASGTATLFALVNIKNPRVLASNASVTTTTAATVYIKGAPVASTNQTFTNSYALKIASGTSYFGAPIEVNAASANVAISCESTDADCMVQVKDNSTAGTNAIGMVATGDDLVMRNDEGNFKVKVANNATDALTLDQSGNLNVTGLVTAKQRHVMNCGFNVSSSGKKYFPFGYGGTIETAGTSGYGEYIAFTAPCNGYLDYCILRTEGTPGSTTMALHLASDGTEVPSTTATHTTAAINMSTDDISTKFSFGSTDGAFTAGQVIVIGANFSSACYDTWCTAVLVLDWNNEIS